MSISATEWEAMCVAAKAELAGMVQADRMARRQCSDMLVDGGRISHLELSRVNAFCDLLIATVGIDADGNAYRTGATQELVQFLLRSRAALAKAEGGA